jgi:hypothetical protein
VGKNETEPTKGAVSFADDVAFLRKYVDVQVLSDRAGRARVAVVPDWQGRVMTSTAQGLHGSSFGWLNRELIASREILPHFNPRGGEDRIWLGPEGGQFSIYFAAGAPFDLEHWFVPKAFDTMPFEVVSHSSSHLSVQAKCDLTNYSGAHFRVQIMRDVRVLEPEVARKLLSVPASQTLSLVAYESENTLINAGDSAWQKTTGLLSLWILGMFTPSPESAIVIPIQTGSEATLGKRVTSDYFGEIPADRLKVTDTAVFMRADGRLRSKVGISPRRSTGRLGEYDALSHVLTIVLFDQPPAAIDYVNSLWKLQADPFAGDAANAYNDGPPAPGKPPMGPFFELESSSPAAALAPGERLTHIHWTFHIVGPEKDLDRVARSVLGLSLKEIQSPFASSADDAASPRAAN